MNNLYTPLDQIKYFGKPSELHVQSNGLGVQSAAMYLMSSLGIIPRFDVSIFADPGREKKETYKYLEWLVDWQKKNDGIPLLVVPSKGNLYNDLINGTNSTGNRFASIPAYTKEEGDSKEGMLRRQCSDEYKIAVINAAIKRLYGKKGKQRYPKTYIYIGFTLEECDRMKTNDIKELINVFPFCNYAFSKNYGIKQQNYHEYLGFSYRRSDCTNWLIKNGFPVPPKSSCTFCPYQSDMEWLTLKTEDPEEFQDVAVLDRKFRNSTKKGVTKPIYLHRSCMPIDEIIEWKEDQERMFDCTGHCGT